MPTLGWNNTKDFQLKAETKRERKREKVGATAVWRLQLGGLYGILRSINSTYQTFKRLLGNKRVRRECLSLCDSERYKAAGGKELSKN